MFDSFLTVSEVVNVPRPARIAGSWALPESRLQSVCQVGAGRDSRDSKDGKDQEATAVLGVPAVLAVLIGIDWIARS
jgi:hypothetical protein